MGWRKSLYPNLPQEVVCALESLPEESLAAAEEIRMYAGCVLECIAAGRVIRTGLCMESLQMENLLASLSGYALYRFERQMARGYIPLPGGHRAGVCGRIVCEDSTARMSGVTSVCIRICRVIRGVSVPLHRHLYTEAGAARRVLFFGPPGSGKTTVLRDAALYFSERGMRVAVADEREELFPAEEHQRMDVLSGLCKAQAVSQLLRAMAPQLIVTDEIGTWEDARAMEDIVRCGVGVWASAHAESLAGLRSRPPLRRMLQDGVFERYVRLDRERGFRIWDESGREWTENREGEHGELGRRRDGDDGGQCDRISAFGWRTAADLLDSGDAKVSAAHEWRHSL